MTQHKVINAAEKEPDLSVIIPACNAAQTVSRALDCVGRQNLYIEIIVVDDASTDNTFKIAENWGREHRRVPLTILQKREHAYALRARLAGLPFATARDVMFLDADDSWAGEHGLARALRRKRELGSEIIHFRSVGIVDNENIGELLWTAPPNGEQLEGREIFSSYAAMVYMSVQLWNKIYSHSLLQNAAEYVGNSEIFYFDDKFLVSIALMLARSWASANEYIYQYRPNPAWPIEKSAKCIHDLIEIRKKAEQLFPALGIDAATRSNYLNFLDRRLTIHLGRLSIEVEKMLFQKHSPKDILETLTPWLQVQEALPALFSGSHINIQRIIKISRRIHEQY